MTSDNKQEKISKVALYSRVAYADDLEIKEQRDVLIQYAKQNGFRYVTEYFDNGYSGNNLKRPAFEQLQADIKAQKVDMVIIKHVKCISRDILLFNQCVNGWNNQGVKLVVLDGSYEINLNEKLKEDLEKFGYFVKKANEKKCH